LQGLYSYDEIDMTSYKNRLI